MKSFVTTLVLALITVSVGFAQQPVRFNVEIDNVGSAFPVLKSGVVAVPVGASDPAPLFPGDAYEFSFTAPANTVPGSGMRLNLETMFVQSNDFFYAFRPEGLALFDAAGNPVTGDVTDQIFLYDAGTEPNEEPGAGTTQKPDQDPMASDVGPTENGIVRVVLNGQQDIAGFTYPDKEDVIQVTLSHDGGTTFTLRMENVSNGNTLQTSEGPKPVPLSPFVYAVHLDGFMLYEVGEPASEGTERIAEDGFPMALAETVGAQTGVIVPLSPGGFAVHNSNFNLFGVGQQASAAIEAIAEDGNNMPFAQTIPGQSGVIRSGTFGPPPIGPGGSFSFEFNAMPGERLSLATMFVQSNDFFYGFSQNGLELFDNNGNPVSGDVTQQVILYDAGTEVDEEPGVGPNQVIRQSGLDTGMDENGVIVSLGLGNQNDGFTYPPNNSIIRVTITPQQTTPFYVRIDNVSDGNTLSTSEGSKPVPLSPGVWAVHTDQNPFYTLGQSASEGIERIAEDGFPMALLQEASSKDGIVASAIFSTPIGADGPAPLFPGDSYEFTVNALPGERLSFATMFVQSNDFFYAPKGEGITLFDNSGNPIAETDVTAQVFLYDAGTEPNEEPGAGTTQKPDQDPMASDVGPTENGVVMVVLDGDMDISGFRYPDKANVIRVTVIGNTTVSNDPGADVPEAFELHANYPNPFNPSTTIRFDLPEAGQVNLSIYNLLGQKVTDLASGTRAAGSYQVVWNGRDSAGQSVPSGVYLYRLDVNGQRTARTMTLLK